MRVHSEAVPRVTDIASLPPNSSSFLVSDIHGFVTLHRFASLVLLVVCRVLQLQDSCLSERSPSFHRGSIIGVDAHFDSKQGLSVGEDGNLVVYELEGFRKTYTIGIICLGLLFIPRTFRSHCECCKICF